MQVQLRLRRLLAPLRTVARSQPRGGNGPATVTANSLNAGRVTAIAADSAQARRGTVAVGRGARRHSAHSAGSGPRLPVSPSGSTAPRVARNTNACAAYVSVESRLVWIACRAGTRSLWSS